MTSSRMTLKKPSSARAGGPRKKYSMSHRTAPHAVAIMCKLDPKICSASQAVCSGGLRIMHNRHHRHISCHARCYLESPKSSLPPCMHVQGHGFMM